MTAADGGEAALDSADALFEDAPCGYLLTDAGGTVVRLNRTFEALTGHARVDVLGRRSLGELLTGGSRLYLDTHVLPMLHARGWVSEVAIELRGADGTAIPALLNATLRRSPDGAPAAIRAVVVDARGRRRYEQELLRSRDREQEVAGRLQASFLDGVLTDDPRLPIGIAYTPSAGGLQVGGDWYDAFALTHERVAVVVGDVVGRGLDAAVTMGQLRSAIRALASAGLSPGRLLDALDTYVARHDIGRMTTVVYAEVDLARGRVRMSSAGHMPIALLAPGVPPRFVMEGRGAPLDTYLAAVRRPEATIDVADGTRLVLFTDGLVERAGQSLVSSLDALLLQLQRRRELAPQALATDISETMLRGLGHQDDACVLVAWWRPPQILDHH